MNIPELDDITRALGDIRESCGSCSCEDPEPGYHPPECASTVDVRLQVTEDDWEVCHDQGFDAEPEGHEATATIAVNDDESMLEQAAEQLLMQIEESLAAEELWA